MNKTPSQKMYDNLASGYRDYSRSHTLYLDAVDSVARQIVRSNCSIIDFGAGDGVRINNIAHGITSNLCLVENSDNMLKKIKEQYPDATVLNRDFSAVSFETSEKYDFGTCLWNVLGHLGDEQQVLNGLINIKKSMKQGGLVILDVNNRHNISQYGWRAVRNIVKDCFSYKFKNGDFSFNISVNDKDVPSSVHIFTKHEFERLLKKAGFDIKRRLYINYADGGIKRSALFGQLCYVLAVKKQILAIHPR